MVADYFDVTRLIFDRVKKPNGRSAQDLRRNTENAGKSLFSDKDLLSKSVQVTRRNQKEWLNWNFFATEIGRKRLIEIDELILDAYGLSREPLLTELEGMRLRST